MSIPFSGTFKRSNGVVSAIRKQLRLVNLKAAQKITVKFDPFTADIKHTRDFLHFISAPKVGLTNPDCSLKTEIVCNRSKPTINIDLVPTIAETTKVKNVLIESQNLTCLEILQLLNKHITSLAPVEKPVAVTQTKLEKKVKRK